MTTTYGYVRVSSREQNEDRQIIVLQVLSFVAENERSNIRQRQAEGIAGAKARGARFGRPQIEIPDHFVLTVQAWERKEITFREAVRQCDMSEATFYRRLREYRTENRSA